MKKIVRIGSGKNGDVFCEITFANNNLSITGVEGPLSNGNCKGGCGQIQNNIQINKFAKGWNFDILEQFISIWNEYHLNDMKPYCTHQKELFDFNKKLIVTDYAWSIKFYKLTKKASKGEMNTDEYKKYRTLYKRVSDITIKYKSPRYETDEVKKLLINGYIEKHKTEIMPACWVYPEEHPEGVLEKPCPICGYKYGSQWLRIEVPKKVIKFLTNLPSSTRNRLPKFWQKNSAG